MYASDMCFCKAKRLSYKESEKCPLVEIYSVPVNHFPEFSCKEYQYLSQISKQYDTEDEFIYFEVSYDCKTKIFAELKCIGAALCQNQQSDCAPSEDAE